MLIFVSTAKVVTHMTNGLFNRYVNNNMQLLAFPLIDFCFINVRNRTQFLDIHTHVVLGMGSVILVASSRSNTNIKYFNYIVVNGAV